ncbi:MAG: TfoX/Sxy family protein [Desulfuromonadales bacterium]|nr:TfoX/Sxy family protein [Desulfuromonadales bacterium]
MAFSEQLAGRTRDLLAGQTGLAEKKMFGGVAFLLHGNMAFGILQDELVVRVGPERYQSSLAIPHTREFDITGRPMKGWVLVAAAGVATEPQLNWWLTLGVSYALTLPAKQPL